VKKAATRKKAVPKAKTKPAKAAKPAKTAKTAKPAKATKPTSAKSGPQRRIVEGWTSVASMAIAPDGRAFAGENGGYGVCAWSAGGELLWQRSLAKIGKQSRYSYTALVTLAGDALLVLCYGAKKLFVLDAATGATRAEHAVPADTRAIALSPDGTKLVARIFVETTVFSYPALQPLTKFEQYANQSGIAISADGRLLAVNGHEIHVFDFVELRHLKTWEPENCDWGPSELCFNAEHQLLTAEEKGTVRVWDPREGTLLATYAGATVPGRKTAQAIAVHGDRIAIGRENGTVAVIDRSGAVQHTFTGFNVEVPDTGAEQLAAVAFARDGTQLWVSAAPKKQPSGLSVLDL